MQALRTGPYIGVVIVFALSIAILSFSNGGEPRSLYLCALFALCASPVLYVRSWNGRDAILCIFLTAYFVFYGGLDLVQAVTGTATQRGLGILTLTEIVVLIGVSLIIASYRFGIKVGTPRERHSEPQDWSPKIIVIMGGFIWACGTAAIWIWQVRFQRNGVEFDASVGNLAINLAVLFRMVQPLGVLMLAYAYFKTGSKWLLAVVICVVLAQVFVGFIGDSKELGMKAAILVLITSFLVRGKIPLTWIASIGVFAIFAFPVFQAYRAEIIMARGESRADAAKNIGRAVGIALAAKNRIANGLNGTERSQSFLERATQKGNLDLILLRVGDDVPFQNGATLAPLLTSFVPRLILPDKADSSAGQLFNQEFGLSEDPRTYISPTQMGELYWNFGWSGFFIGMTVIGFGMGVVGARCDLSQHVSLTRVLVLVTTVYATCARFEGSIALEYTLWLRSMAVILLLHWMFARKSATSSFASPQPRALTPDRAPIPNLMR